MTPPGPLIVDGSNYATVPLTTDVIDDLVNAGVVGFMAQANDPPSQYPPSQTADQLRRVIDDGRLIPLWYLFWWAGVSRDFYARQMAPLAGFEGKVAIGMGDVEDTSVGLLAGVRPTALPGHHARRIARQARPDARWYRHAPGKLAGSATGLVDDVLATLEIVRAFPSWTGETLTYSGPWYWGPYLGDPQIASPTNGWMPAEYDGVWDVNVATAWGGWLPPASVKQVRGDATIGRLAGIDLSIASTDFIARLRAAQGGNVSDPADLQRIADLETIVHDLTDRPGEIQAAIATIMQKTTSKPVKTGLGAVQGRLDTINGQAFPA